MKPHQTLLPVLWLAMATGCKQTPAPAQPAPVLMDRVDASSPLAEVRLGDDVSARPELGFTIGQVFTAQEPTKTPPFHRDGGPWLYFDAALVSDAKARFTVGVQASQEGAPMSFGKAVIVSPSHDAGRAFVEAFARAFKVPVPPEGAPGTLAPLELDISTLGAAMGRSEGGGFGGEGTWTATKWFPSFDGDEGEVYFNYDLASRRGEFARKDAEYDASVLAVLASTLRDGLPPTGTSAPSREPRRDREAGSARRERTDPRDASKQPRFTWRAAGDLHRRCTSRPRPSC